MGTNKMTLHYRYWNDNSGSIYLDKFVTVGETAKSYWVIQCCYATFSDDFIKTHRKLVSKTSRKRYCYPSKVEAWESFIHRKHHHINRLRTTLEAAEYVLNVAKERHCAPPGETVIRKKDTGDFF
jgi:hypothetical protein